MNFDTICCTVNLSFALATGTNIRGGEILLWGVGVVRTYRERAGRLTPSRYDCSGEFKVSNVERRTDRVIAVFLSSSSQRQNITHN